MEKRARKDIRKIRCPKCHKPFDFMKTGKSTYEHAHSCGIVTVTDNCLTKNLFLE